MAGEWHRKFFSAIIGVEPFDCGSIFFSLFHFFLKYIYYFVYLQVKTYARCSLKILWDNEIPSTASLP